MILNRKKFLKILGVWVAASALPKNIFPFQNQENSNKFSYLYAGSYCSEKENGLYLLKMTTAMGDVEIENSFGGIINPSFLAISNNKKYLYVVSEIDNYEGRKSGAVYSYKINKNNSLEFINKQSSGGAHPCHIAVDKKDQLVFVANYTGGNISVFPISNNGELGKSTDIINFSGSSINKDRQEAPHAHSVNISPQNEYLLVSDLGTDKIMIYKINYETGKLIPAPTPFIQTTPGSGPRHVSFNPNGRFVYSLNELNSTITVYKYDSNICGLTEIQNCSTIPANFKEENTCAEIVVSQNGKFVYASNRGHNSIAVFSIDESSGKLSLIQHQATLGKTPRNFTIDPTGKYLLAANQNSNSIITFNINNNSGKLGPANKRLEIKNPVCITFYE